jgi:hypothetical protein
MTGLQRVACLIGLAAALVLSASGCTDYTYFNVNVTIDSKIDDATLRDIDSCVAYVFAGDKQIEQGELLKKLDGTAACKAPTTGTDQYGNTTYNLGTMDYSSARSSGTIKFFVNMVSLEGNPAAQGSAQGDANPGQVLTLNLVAAPCGGTSEPTCQDISSWK